MPQPPYRAARAHGHPMAPQQQQQQQKNAATAPPAHPSKLSSAAKGEGVYQLVRRPNYLWSDKSL